MDRGRVGGQTFLESIRLSITIRVRRIASQTTFRVSSIACMYYTTPTRDQPKYKAQLKGTV